MGRSGANDTADRQVIGHDTKHVAPLLVAHRAKNAEDPAGCRAKQLSGRLPARVAVAFHCWV
jgi:hypothetical protein